MLLGKVIFYEMIDSSGRRTDEVNFRQIDIRNHGALYAFNGRARRILRGQSVHVYPGGVLRATNLLISAVNVTVDVMGEIDADGEGFGIGGTGREKGGDGEGYGIGATRGRGARERRGGLRDRRYAVEGRETEMVTGSYVRGERERRGGLRHRRYAEPFAFIVDTTKVFPKVYSVTIIHNYCKNMVDENLFGEDNIFKVTFLKVLCMCRHG